MFLSKVFSASLFLHLSSQIRLFSSAQKSRFSSFRHAQVIFYQIFNFKIFRLFGIFEQKTRVFDKNALESLDFWSLGTILLGMPVASYLKVVNNQEIMTL